MSGVDLKGCNVWLKGYNAGIGSKGVIMSG